MLKWVGRFKKGGCDALRDRISRPRHSPRRTQSTFIERVLALRQLRWNGWRIARELHLNRATVSRTLRRAGMNRLRSLDPPPPVMRYEHKRPGDLIHFDIKRLARIVKPGHRVHGDRTQETRSAGYKYVHIAIDDHSRISFAAILPDQTSASAERFIQTVLREWAYARTCQNSPERETELDPWLHDYNFHRPHASLNLNTPISRSGLNRSNLMGLHS